MFVEVFDNMFRKSFPAFAAVAAGEMRFDENKPWRFASTMPGALRIVMEAMERDSPARCRDLAEAIAAMEAIERRIVKAVRECD